MSKRQGGKVKPVKGAVGAKATEKKKQAVADKTFGMKNKKGKTAQKAAQTYQSAGKTKEDKKKDEARELRKKTKEENQKLEAERAMLFKTVDHSKPKQKPQIAPPGVDPKSVLCINFKAGYCAQGDTCPFAHDLAVERKAERRDIYSDQRELETMKSDTMDMWDERKLAEVIAKKAAGRPGNPTAGICKHFISALEEQKFGWFWECPAGDKCPYRHALPPGFKLKKQKEDKNVERPIEDILEEKRQALTGGTPVTTATFTAWKQKIIKQRAADEKKNKHARNQAIQSGKLKKTGREILQEGGGNFKEEMEDGEDLDIKGYLKQKKEEEEAMDRENAELVKIISAEVAESERAFDREVAALEAQGLSAAEAMARLSLISQPADTDPDTYTTNTHTTNTHTTDEDDQDGQDDEEYVDDTVLEGVDTGLFAEEAEEDLPEFSDDDDE